MQYTVVALALLALAFARPDVNDPSFKARTHARDVRAPQGAFVRPRWNIQLNRREVPQEHSHEKFLTTVRTSLNADNPAQIADPVFGLLGNAAAAGGAGQIGDTECLQQATADQAFTNAKSLGDVTGMTAALVYRALERNTGKVGLASNSCTTITAINPEIAALQQHQDPTSPNAAATNKQITLDLAVQIASIGGDAATALESGTFAPGQIGDPTAAGNTCDVQTDPVGCIFTQNLLVEDATVDEINAAVAAAGGTVSSTAGQVVSNATALVADGSFAPQTAAASTDGLVTMQTITDQAISTMMMTMTQTVTECATAVAPPAGMTAVTMPSAAATSVISIAISLGIQISVGNPDATAAPIDSSAAVQTNMQVQTEAALASATMTAAPPPATTSVDCSEAISSALAAAGLAGAAALTSTSAATTTAAFSNTTTTANAAAATLTPPSSTNTTASSLDLGTCPNPTIIFADNLDGRNEPSFAPADEATFTHGSALGIKVITDFICQQLDVKCKASAATITACNQGAAAAQQATGQAAADAFNAALGF